MYIVGERIKTMAGEEIEDGSKENLCRECAQKQEKYEKKKVERGLRLYDAVCPALQRAVDSRKQQNMFQTQLCPQPWKKRR